MKLDNFYLCIVQDGIRIYIINSLFTKKDPLQTTKTAQKDTDVIML